MSDLTFVVPPGIGDISWIYSKVKALAQQRSVAFSICNDPPQRSQLFVDLLPGIKNLGYEKDLPYWKAFNEILPSDTRLGDLPSGRYVLTLNPHLESGRKLAEAYPDQPTDYHYELTLPSLGSRVSRLLNIGPTGVTGTAGVTGVKERNSNQTQLIGVYCSSYQHREDILFWRTHEWMAFLRGVKNVLPAARFVVIGAPYDDRTIEVGDALFDAGEYPLIFTSQSIGFTCKILKALDYFFAFPSGLGVLADVLNVPAMMWFWGNLPDWGHVKGLFGAYADPSHTESGFHLMAPYENPEMSLQRWIEQGLRHVRTIDR